MFAISQIRAKVLRAFSIAALALLAALAVLLIVEAGVRLFLAKPEVVERHENFYLLDPLLAIRGKPLARAHVTSTVQGKTIYDVTYGLNEYGWRNIPRNTRQKSDKFALFFGASHIFGLGVNDNQTLPYYFSALAPEFHSYSLALRNYAPSMFYGIAKNLDRYANVTERSGYIFYHFDLEMVKRQAGTINGISWAGPPAYILDAENKPHFIGNFTELYPIRTWLFRWLFNHVDTLRFFRADFPPISERDIKLTCALIVETKKQLESQLPRAQFKVVLFDWEPSPFRECFSQNNIETVILDLQKAQKIPNDGHFTAEGNKEMAEQLLKSIKVSP